MLRQSQALEMAEEATDVSQVGIGGWTLRSLTSRTMSALISSGSRRARALLVVAVGFPGKKTTEVQPLVSTELSSGRAPQALTKLFHWSQSSW